jgi:hypothetical protein
MQTDPPSIVSMSASLRLSAIAPSKKTRMHLAINQDEMHPSSIRDSKSSLLPSPTYPNPNPSASCCGGADASPIPKCHEHW